ncbi:MAG: outer membrane protein transport protein [Candidatus Eiseniibacteriota bacterium]|jgi:long-chain fatty acid transport protein
MTRAQPPRPPSPLTVILPAAALSLLLLVGRPAGAGAAGFAIYEQGARAMAMGGAFAAVADDPSAMFYNPAGLARADSRQLYVGPSFIVVPARQFAGIAPYPGYGVEAESTADLFYPVNAYLVMPLDGRWTLGAFLNSPFGLKVEWDDPARFPGRYVSTHSEVIPFYFGSQIGVALGEHVALGGGVTLAHSSVTLRQYLSRTFVGLDQGAVLDVGTVELEASNGLDVGFAFGLLVEPAERWNVGFGYRHQIEIDYEGDADFTQLETGLADLDALIAALLPSDQAARTAFAFPTQWSLGIATTALEGWTLAFDWCWTEWSSFDQLRIEFDDPQLAMDRPQGWEDVFSYRLGAEWRWRPAWALRAGAYIDDNPQPDRAVSPLLPDADRVGLSLGFGHTFGRYTIDVYDLVVLFDERSTHGMSQDRFDGSYQSFANAIGFDLGIRF